MGGVKDEVGNKHGRLTVLSRAENSSKGQARWLCLCDCGNETIAWGTSLRNGNTRSCGCLHIETITTHGKHESPEYSSWENMHARCNNPSYRCYSDYGGRGIKVCDEWKTFEQFYADMGDKPSDSHSIDRIDSSLGYCPENCRWATKKEQVNNRRNNVVVAYKGESKTLSEWCDELGFSRSAIRYRLGKGYSPERAFEEPIHKKKG